MGLFSKVIALETVEAQSAGNRPGLLDRATSSRPTDTARDSEAAAARPSSPVKKKVRELRRHTTRRSHRSR